MQKDTQPSQVCSGEHITPNPTKVDTSDALLLMGRKLRVPYRGTSLGSCACGANNTLA
jgi:hypothetical protein